MALGNLRVTLGLAADQYLSGIKEAQREADQFKRKFDPLSRTLKDVGAAMTTAGAKLTAGITVPLAAIGGLSLKAGMDFETAFTGVRKTVDATTVEMGALRNQIREMGKDSPIGAAGLADIAAAAGQLGIKSKNIAEFTKTMEMLGVTTNLSATEAATAMARFDNVTGGTQQNFGRLASAIVDLGNNLATTEREIVDMAQRLAGAGHIVGLTQADILGLAGALSSVGIEAEAGGTAFTRVMIRMDDAVKQGGKDLQLFSAVAGLDFRKAFQDDAAMAINAFIAGLAKMSLEGKSLTPVLTALELGEIRVSNSLRLTGNAAERTAASVQTSREAFAHGGKAAEEYAKRMEDTEQKLGKLKSRFADIGVTIFDAMHPIIHGVVLPGLEKLADGIAYAAEAFASLPKPIQAAAFAIAGIAAAAGPVLFSLGMMSTGLGTMIPIATRLISLLSTGGGLTGALTGISQAMKALPLLASVKSFGDLSAAVSLIGGSSALATAGLVGVAAAIGTAIGMTVNWILKITGLQEGFDRLLASTVNYIPVIGKYITGQANVTEATKGTGDAQKALVAELKKRNIAVDESRLNDEKYVASLGAQVRAATAAERAASGQADAIKKVGPAAKDAGAGLAGLNDLLSGTGEKTDKAAQAAKRFREQVDSIKFTLTDTTPPAKELVTAIHELHKTGSMSSETILALKNHVGELKNSKDPLIQQYLRMIPLIDMASRAWEIEAEAAKTISDAASKIKFDDVQLIGVDFEADLSNIKNPELADIVTANSSRRVEDYKDKLGELRSAIPAVETKINELKRAGASNAEVMEMMGGEIQRVAEQSKRLGAVLPSATAEIARQAEATQRAAERAKNFEQAWATAMANLTTRIAEGFADLLFEGGSFADKMINIAKDTAKGMLSSFLSGLISPLTDALGQLGRDAANGISAAIFGGDKGGIGGLFSRGKGSGAPGLNPDVAGILGMTQGMGMGGGGAAAGAAGMISGFASKANMFGAITGGINDAIDIFNKTIGQIGLGRKAADEIVKSQNSFTQSMESIISDGNLAGSAKLSMVNQLWDDFQANMTRFAATDPNNQKVANQAFATLAPWITQIRKDLAQYVTDPSTQFAPFNEAVAAFREAIDRFGGLAIATTTGLPQLADGGMLLKTGAVFAHQGEVVLPPQSLLDIVKEKQSEIASMFSKMFKGKQPPFLENVTYTDATGGEFKQINAPLFDRLREQLHASISSVGNQLAGNSPAPEVKLSNTPNINVTVNGTHLGSEQIRGVIAEALETNTDNFLTKATRAIKANFPSVTIATA